MRRQSLKIADDGYNILLKACDFFIINAVLSLLISSQVRGETAVDFAAGFLFSVVFILIGEYCSLYKKAVRLNISQSLIKCTVSFVLTIISWLILRNQLMFLDGIDYSNLRQLLLNGWFALSLVGLLLFRVSVIFCIHKYWTSLPARRIAIIGMTSGGLAIESALRKELKGQNFIIEYYDDRDVSRFGYMTKSENKGKVNELIDQAKQGNVDEVYIALPMIARERIKYFLQLFSDTTVETYIVPDLYTYNLAINQFREIGNVQTFSVFASPFDGIGDLIKRTEDLVIGSIILLLISPILLAVAIGVKLSSPGPVLFKQDRYGLGGKCIKVWKFRSMKVMENDSVVTQATKNDPRVTKFGAFIRRTSLDELPQFFNVIQGSMSIVGPRPHAVAHNEEYRVLVDNYMIRHKVKPGITGLAQVNGFRGETDTLDKMEMRIRYDIRYIQSWSLLLDLKIIFLTVFKGFVGETAY
ncbi:undecaprenyl-phosphate glucose phosphotransferase [Photobacterium damselae]|uniref:undecaprenyl-phosphate glucose phosphotransferase n=1 Tax=Photobacterium damselae TaxID=38293 RepID=UPI001EFE59AF|nr:undecaprenyl-phosphate glucose phosphotransferase [Photobacterium damselae]MCG9780173.1 undecaprenyl-phosphate glucose phosphotransferase [Photobacterium damselae]